MAGGSTSNTIAKSSDGIIWTGLSNTVFNTQCNGIAWNGYLFVAVGASSGLHSVATSSDGITWTGLNKTIFTPYYYSNNKYISIIYYIILYYL